jgi:hypothetical protein
MADLVSTLRSLPQTPTVTVGTYASGNVVGGLLTFPNMVRSPGVGGLVQTVIVRDKAGQNVSYDLFLFDAAPTTQTDKTAVALTAADLAKCIGVVSLSGAVLGAAATMGVLTATGLALAFKLPGGTTPPSPALYGILVTRGAPVYASTSDVSVELVVLPD